MRNAYGFEFNENGADKIVAAAFLEEVDVVNGLEQAGLDATPGNVRDFAEWVGEAFTDQVYEGMGEMMFEYARAWDADRREREYARAPEAPVEAEGEQIEVSTCLVRGCEGIPAAVRAHVVPSRLPGIDIVGMSDRDCIEMRSVLRCAIKAAGFEVPRLSINVSVVPGDLPGGIKSPRMLELPLAAAILAASGQIPLSAIEDRVLVGGLSLDGSLEAPRGIPLAQMACHECAGVLTSAAADGAVAEPGPAAATAYGIESLADLRGGRDTQRPLRSLPPERAYGGDMADLAGNEDAKRAVTVALAGRHGLLVDGDDVAASAIAPLAATCLPEPDPRERRLIDAIGSLGDSAQPCPSPRPYRSCPAAASTARLVGGGRPVRPGEVTLASGGVLRLEGVESMWPTTHALLAQVVEDGTVKLARADGAYSMPADTQLVGTPTSGLELPARQLARLGRVLPVRAHAEPSDGKAPSQSSADIAAAVAAARDFAETGPGREPARSDDPEDIVARTVADLDASPRVEQRHQDEAWELTRHATGRPRPSAAPAPEVAAARPGRRRSL